jgi:hypothetical protein
MDAIDELAPFQIWHHGPANRNDSAGTGDAVKQQQQQAVRKICAICICTLCIGGDMSSVRMHTHAGLPATGWHRKEFPNTTVEQRILARERSG